MTTNAPAQVEQLRQEITSCIDAFRDLRVYRDLVHAVNGEFDPERLHAATAKYRSAVKRFIKSIPDDLYFFTSERDDRLLTRLAGLGARLDSGLHLLDGAESAEDLLLWDFTHQDVVQQALMDLIVEMRALAGWLGDERQQKELEREANETEQWWRQLTTPKEELSNEAQAIAALSMHPTWTVKQIAEHVGVHPKRPYKWREFIKAWDALHRE